MLGGGGLMAAFPLAYAVVMPALYPPIIAMLLGAGVPRRRLRIPLARPSASATCWDVAFAGGSLLATLAQGIALGALLRASTSRAAPMPAAGGTG